MPDMSLEPLTSLLPPNIAALLPDLGTALGQTALMLALGLAAAVLLGAREELTPVLGLDLDAARMGANMRAYNMITAFANIKLQDTDRVVRAIRDDPITSMVKIGAAITVPSVALWAAKALPDGLPVQGNLDPLLLIAGGVVTAELDTPEVIAWIAASSARAALTASVCTGAFLLAEAGLLDGRTATTHWEDIPDMQARYPAVNTVAGQRWVDEGSIVTSAGISAGIDMSLHLVERLAGRELALLTAHQMDFDWQENRRDQNA